MRRMLLRLGALVVAAVSLRSAGEARLVRYPDYQAGRIAFTYLGDIWIADESGQNARRLTVHKARDVYPRFSPDGKWVAFSSDRNGNLDVFIVPVAGGAPKQLTSHSADDSVLGWTPDSKAVLFASQRAEDFYGKLYTVSVDGGMPKNAGPDMGVWASYSPDGSKLALNRHGQVYWRKYYRGSNATDITIMDVAAKTFTNVTDFKGIDSWPMWGSDGFIYFVSDREGNGLTNIWRVSDKSGTGSGNGNAVSAAEQVTTFKTGDVRWPSISRDGKVVMFEHDFGIWKLDVASRKAAPVPIDIATETEENTSDVRSFTNEADDYNLDPSGRRIVFSIHGEVFTAPTDEGDLTQVTDSPARDRDAVYAPDGKHLAFVSDRSGREELYLVSPDGAGEPQAITNLDALKLSFIWSPDSKAIAFVASDNVLRRYDIDTKRTLELSTAKYGTIGTPTWSPDGQWIAYSKADAVRTNDIFLVPAAGGAPERRVTFDSYNNLAPRFAPNGRRLYFIRSDGFLGAGGGGAFGAGTQIYAIDLERQEHDPDDPVERADRTDRAERAAPPQGAEAPAAQSPAPTSASASNANAPRAIDIDWNGLKRRTRQVTRMPFPISSFAIAPDSRTIAFVTTEPAGPRTQPAIYTIQQDGKRVTRVIAGESPGAGGDDDDTPAAAGGGGPGINTLMFARDGRMLFFKESRGVYAVGLGGGNVANGANAASAQGAAREGARRRITFSVKVRIDRQAEWAEMFGDAWRTMKYRFYDAKMHGHDWDAMKAKYEPLVAHVGDRQELLNIINEMIGELNASHTGAAPPPPGRDTGTGIASVSTGYLGLDLEPDDRAGRYRVSYVYEGGPADKDWVKVSVGDYLIAINGKPVKAGDEYWQLLNYRLNRKVEVTFSSTPAGDAANTWKTRIAPIRQTAHNQLRYERWVKERRNLVEKLSAGRVGYLHIQAMNQPSLRKFEKELRENRGKQGLVIDERWNGGGNIDQELLGILVQREYQIWQPRGTEPNPRPFSGFFGPKVVLQNWRSASNAEMFPAGFRALGLGKVIGSPTMGAVIGTGSYSLIDGSTVRTPGVGVYLSDAAKTNMENYGVQPDILVENTPEDYLAGRDRELETAVNELLRQLGGKPAAPRPTSTSSQGQP